METTTTAVAEGLLARIGCWTSGGVARAQTGRPVVFLKRDAPPKYGTYYEFRPKDGCYEAFEYKEKDVESGIIASLQEGQLLRAFCRAS